MEWLANQAKQNKAANQSPNVTSICFADGTCQTTAPTATGDMSKSAENEMTATGSIVLANGSYIATNKNDGLMIDLSGGNVVFAVSADGATQSSGCVVAVTMYAGAAGSDGAPSNVARFTSTTTANLDLANASSFGPSRPGVLLESCAPGAFCKVGMRGIFRAVATNTGYSPTGSVLLNFSGTRCKPVGAGSPPSISTIVGHFMSPTDSQGNFWFSVGP